MPMLGDDMNKACIRGTLRTGVFGEAKMQHSGMSVIRVTVETVQTWYRDGEQKRASEFHRIVIFDPACRAAALLTRNGDRVYVEGHLQTRRWDKGPNMEGRKTEIVLNPGECQFLRLGDPDAERGPEQQENDENGNGPDLRSRPEAPLDPD
jgi:single-strand DNA-binding protein